MPNDCRMGSQNPTTSPTTPKQPQQITTITTMVMIQGLVFFGPAVAGGRNDPGAWVMN